jgi:hypothetical protein
MNDVMLDKQFTTLGLIERIDRNAQKFTSQYVKTVEHSGALFLIYCSRKERDQHDICCKEVSHVEMLRNNSS